MNKTKKMITMALFTTIALTIFMIESYIPPLAPIPGIKLGLSNIITLAVIILWGWKEGAIILFMRIILGSIFAGQMMSFIYSFAGGTLCLITMCMVKRFFQKDMIWVISIIGAIAHNIGQILIACIVVNSTSILFYIPILVISSIVTGTFTGLSVQYLIRNNNNINKLFKIVQAY